MVERVGKRCLLPSQQSNTKPFSCDSTPNLMFGRGKGGTLRGLGFVLCYVGTVTPTPSGCSGHSVRIYVKGLIC